MIKLSDVVKVRRGEDFSDRGEIITSLSVANSFVFDGAASDEQKIYGINRSLGVIFDHLYGDIIERLKRIIDIAELNRDGYAAMEAQKLLKDILDIRGVVEEIPQNQMVSLKLPPQG